MTATIYALVHRTCGHAAGTANDRGRLEYALGLLAAAGYHQWRVVVATDEQLAALLMQQRCDACRIDPMRGTIAEVAEYVARRRP